MFIIQSFIKPNCVKQHLVRTLTTTHQIYVAKKVNIYDMNFDRRIKVSHVDSINYMNSKTYTKNYGDNLVWELYRRNFKGQFPSENTRRNCVNSEGFLMTSYPCPICRDEYLVLHHENVKLLQQFIDSHTGKIRSTTEHGLCLKQYRNLIIAIQRAKDFGTLVVRVPDRLYDYEQYYADKIK